MGEGGGRSREADGRQGCESHWELVSRVPDLSSVIQLALIGFSLHCPHTGALTPSVLMHTLKGTHVRNQKHKTSPGSPSWPSSCGNRTPTHSCYVYSPQNILEATVLLLYSREQRPREVKLNYWSHTAIKM